MDNVKLGAHTNLKRRGVLSAGLRLPVARREGAFGSRMSTLNGTFSPSLGSSTFRTNTSKDLVLWTLKADRNSARAMVMRAKNPFARRTGRTGNDREEKREMGQLIKRAK